MLIGITLETAAGEARVAVTPETAKKLKSQGHQILVQSGAGISAATPDAAYAAMGAEIVNVQTALACDLVLKVRSPSAQELALMKRGATLVGMLNPFDREGLERLAAAGVTSFALEAAPRTTRAQSMDVLSSQANIASYKAVIIAISAIVIVGAMLAAPLTEPNLGKTMGVLAVALAAVNVFGGFLVTRRMLEMFRKKDKKAAAAATQPAHQAAH